MASAALLLGETLNSLQLLGAVLIMAGLYINVFGLRIVRPGMARGKKSPGHGAKGILQALLVVIGHAQFI
jgi:hypothetical protein